MKDYEKTTKQLINEPNELPEESSRLDDSIIKSEERLRAFIDATTSSIGIYDENLNLVEINKTGLQWWPEKRKEDLIGLHITELVTGIEKTELFSQLKEVISTGKSFIDHQHIPSTQFGEMVMEFDSFKVGKGVAIITNDITERYKTGNELRKTQEELIQSTHDLGERVKELNCLYGISSLVERDENSLEMILQGTVKLIPLSFQYPEDTCARIVLEDREFITENFKESKLLQCSKIIVEGSQIGTVEVFNIEKRPPGGTEGQFLKEELKLIEAIAERLGKIIRRMRAEEQSKVSLVEKEALLREIHHRVKNNLQIINNFIQFQQVKYGDEKNTAILVDLKNRVKTMALIHERLYRSDDFSQIDFSVYMKELADELFVTYGVDRSRISLITSTENITLDLDRSITCGLIINELVTNSLKYAFPDNLNGKLELSLNSDDNIIELVVSDNGIGLAVEPGGYRTFGLKLVTGWVNQIDGKMEINRTTGTKYIIRFSNQE